MDFGIFSTPGLKWSPPTPGEAMMNPDPRNIIRMKSIGKSFGSINVLREVSVDFRAGEVHILAGENGAGKSTLIKVLSGNHAHYEGRIELEGKQVHFSSPIEANRAGISVIHQELSLVDSMSVADNLMLGREPCHRGNWLLDHRKRDRLARDHCRILGLEFTRQELSTPVGQFPISIRNQLEIAKALGFEAKVLIMDEPTSALNNVEADHLFSLIEGLKKKGCAIIYITHKMEEIRRLADRVTVLRNGRLVWTKRRSEFIEQELIEAMIGRDMDQFFPERRKFLQVPTSTPRLEVKNLRIPHPDPLRPDLVKDFTVELQAGEIVGLAGLQGSGCSQVMNALFGSVGPVQGNITIDGTSYQPRSPAHSIRNGIAFLTSDRKRDGLVLEMGIRPNITLAALPALSVCHLLSLHRETEHANMRIQDLSIRFAGLTQPVGLLSGGNQQKVVLAKWLETNPRILMLDEPTRGVDVGAKQEIYRLIRNLAGQGIAILMISTEMPELLGLADRILVLHQGQIRAQLEHGEASQEKILSAAMGATS